MKIVGAKAIAYCEKPKASDNAILLFGGDSGLVASMADTLIAKRIPDPDPTNIIRMTDEDLKQDNARLADELVARSMFGGDRVIRLRMEKDTQARQVIEILADIDSGSIIPEALWIIEARDLNKTSKIRGAFEASKKAVALQLFADDEQGVTDFAASRLREANVDIEPDALAAFAAELPGDRRLAISEVEKLTLYAFELGRPVTVEDVNSIASAEQPKGADVAADAAIAGDIRASAEAIDRFLQSGGSPISAMRTLHFRMLRVLDAVAMEFPSGRKLRPPIFEREWPAYSRALKDWSGLRVERTLAQLYLAEKACKQAGAPAEAILSNLLLNVARRSA